MGSGFSDAAHHEPRTLHPERTQHSEPGTLNPTVSFYFVSLNPAGTARSSGATVVTTFSTSVVDVMNVARALPASSPPAAFLAAAFFANPPSRPPTDVGVLDV